MNKTEILKEVESNIKEMEILINSQIFTIADAKKYKERWFNIYRSMEQLAISRDKWKKKYMELNGKINIH